jgi:nucleotide-binding universal stress UspA family protein
VVVGCDGSPDAFHAVRFLARLPLGRETTARLVGVAAPVTVPPKLPGMLSMPWPLLVASDALDEQKQRLEGALTRAAAELRPAVGVVATSVVSGHPAVEILAASDEPDVDLVVVGARGLGLFGRLMLGSVSDRVVHHAPCTVLVVKAKA